MELRHEEVETYIRDLILEHLDKLVEHHGDYRACTRANPIYPGTVSDGYYDDDRESDQCSTS